MGGALKPWRSNVTFQITTPAPGHIRLVRHGEVAAETIGAAHLLYHTYEPGAYRAEVFAEFAGRKRAWIYSNPIYIR
jgi:hypothetical protein